MSARSCLWLFWFSHCGNIRSIRKEILAPKCASMTKHALAPKYMSLPNMHWCPNSCWFPNVRQHKACIIAKTCYSASKCTKVHVNFGTDSHFVPVHLLLLIHPVMLSLKEGPNPQWHRPVQDWGEGGRGSGKGQWRVEEGGTLDISLAHGPI